LFEEPEEPPADDPEASSDPVDKIFAFDGEPSLVYLGSLLAASALLIAAAALGDFPWLASIVGVVVFLATMFRGGRWVALAGGIAIVGIVLVSAWPQERTLADAIAEGDATATIGQSGAEEQAPEGSLGFQLGEVTALWNELDQGPLIRRGLVRTPESGQFDGFVYQFDDGASVAGAYDPQEEYVYALLASVRLSHESADNMYVHLCYMVHPFSQECIDGYLEQGLGGEPLESYQGTRHSAEWQVDGVTWRVDIGGGVQELRALGERSS
jgi:hypothetical protein